MKQAGVCSKVLRKTMSRPLHAGLLAAALSLSMSAWAQSSTAVHFDIPAQKLSAALRAYADQAGMQLLYRPDVVGNVEARPVQGNLDKREALQRLLDGTGLVAVYSSENAVTVRPAAPPSTSGQKKRFIAECRGKRHGSSGRNTPDPGSRRPGA